MSRLILASLCLFLAGSAGAADAGEFIAYRLTNQKEMHFDDPGKANQHLATVKKLGCEARQDSHGGHTDVVYRSPKWQALEVATDELAHQWEGWLKGAGFETLHGHAEDHAGQDHSGHNHGPEGAEEVAYRLAEWTTTHAEPDKIAEMVALLKGLGCEIQSDEHEGHTDVSVRCPQWKHVELPSHQAAQGWEGWLKKMRFEVRHSH